MLSKVRDFYYLKKWEVMSLSKLFSMMFIAMILIGVGALTTISISSNAHDHGVHVVSLDAHQHGDVDQSNPPSKHEHPNNQGDQQGNCHSLVCSSSAMFLVSTVSLIKSTGDRISLLPVDFVQGQPIPPSEYPPKLIA